MKLHEMFDLDKPGPTHTVDLEAYLEQHPATVTYFQLLAALGAAGTPYGVILASLSMFLDVLLLHGLPSDLADLKLIPLESL